MLLAHSTRVSIVCALVLVHVVGCTRGLKALTHGIRAINRTKRLISGEFRGM